MFDLFDNTEHSPAEYGFCMSGAFYRKLMYQQNKNILYTTLKGVHLRIDKNKTEYYTGCIIIFNDKTFVNINEFISIVEMQSKLYEMFYYKLQNKQVIMYTRDVYNLETIKFKDRTWVL